MARYGCTAGQRRLGLLQPVGGSEAAGPDPVLHRRLLQKTATPCPSAKSCQALFAEILPYVTGMMKERFASGDTIIQTDRQIGDAPGRSFHARQLLFGTDYPQLPYMWQQLTFDLPDADLDKEPQILEVSIPRWLDDLGLPQDLKDCVQEAGLTQLIFKAPTKGLSLHLGFDYMGEHKMGPLSVAMFMVKQANGLALQAALSMARVKTLKGDTTNTALVTTGPSLHGKSTLTIMIELVESDLAKLLDLAPNSDEGIYPMNDDIILPATTPRTYRERKGRQADNHLLWHRRHGEQPVRSAPLALHRRAIPLPTTYCAGPRRSPTRRRPWRTSHSMPQRAPRTSCKTPFATCG